jgi:glycosyltransferase involved in cell wall biosynthesis
LKSQTIAVNTRFLLANRLEGIGRFSTETLRLITQQHPEHQFVFLFDRPYSNEFLFADNITPKVVFPPTRHPLLWYWWFEQSVPRALQQCKANVFVSPDGYCSLSATTPTLMVVHDLAFEHFPEQVPFLARHYYQHFSPKYAHRAQRLATVSEYTKNDLVQRYKVSPDKIDIVYNGVTEGYAPISNQQKTHIKQQYANGADYFLFVGAIHPRKNLANILRAFDQFKQQNTNRPIKMLIAGRKAWHSQDAFDAYEAMTFKTDVVFVGHLQVTELSKVVAAATAMVYASLFEGFGIPIIEAMHCHTPVITANVSSMPEVAGSAALLVNPTQPTEIAQAMQQIYHNPNLQKQLIEQGAVQVQKFTWQNSANQLWAAIEKLL